jgi:hypothetical protein
MNKYKLTNHDLFKSETPRETRAPRKPSEEEFTRVDALNKHADIRERQDSTVDPLFDNSAKDDDTAFNVKVR